MSLHVDLPPCWNVDHDVLVNVKNGSLICREVVLDSDNAVCDFTGDIIVIFNPSATVPHSLKLTGRKIQEFILKTT